MSHMLTETNNPTTAGGEQLDPVPVPSEQEVTHVASVPPSKYLMSLTGYDELAIASHFGMHVATMRKEDAITLGRALAFVHYRRNEGATDLAAHDRAMSLSMQEVVDFFPPEAKRTDGTTDDTASPGLADTYAEQAVAVVRIGIAPSEWKALSAGERTAIIEEHNYVASKGR
jgi:hypothetical protein